MKADAHNQLCMGGSMKKGIKWVTAAILFIIASCAVITVNIYFPEKDVKEAYKNLEKELMTPEERGPAQKQEGAPSQKPESSIRFEFAGTAYAQEPGLAGRIADIVKRMPDVVNAYREMGARSADTERLRDSGGVGEGNNGLLVVRNGGLSAADRTIVENENENRKTVMRGMAKAIVRINRAPENDENLKQVLPQATAEFAAIRRDSAKKGWWVQDANGNWSRK
jgi:uncharacterized protein YdbL (DUF1318 family)